jgi:CRP/FNR family transcriptional regulator, cyclic AMP receptor protein
MSGARPQRILDLDSDLAAAVPEEERERARAGALAHTRTLPRGAWDAIGDYGECADWMGLLVIDGFLARETTCAAEAVTEIIGPGDLLRPWDHDGDYPLEGITTAWQVLRPVTIALLDADFARRAAPWPALTVTILARIGRRARWLGLRLLISQLPGVPIRVFYLLWHLSERWGERIDGAMRVPVRLTHEQIAELIGAQRPSVSSAIASLRAEGVVRLPGNGWQIPLDTPALIDRMLHVEPNQMA